MTQGASWKMGSKILRTKYWEMSCETVAPRNGCIRQTAIAHVNVRRRFSEGSPVNKQL